MLRYRLEHSGTRDPWVLDYYDQSRLPLDDARLVSGSDVVGPMGPDFVPVRASRAEGFIADGYLRLSGRGLMLADGILADLI
jgi:hypothetical protein